MPQHTAALPIACVEGWSTHPDLDRGTAARPGRPRRRPGPGVGARDVHWSARAPSAQARSSRNQVPDPDALLALRVNGADLSLDHGFPARVIVPALPGVHNTKWVSSIRFEAD